MKNKNYFPLVILFIIITIFLLQSCAITDKVTNSTIIQKRKYTHGFYVNIIQNNIKTAKNNKLRKQTTKDANAIINKVVLNESFNNFERISDTNSIHLIASSKEIPVIHFREKLPPLPTLYKPPKKIAKRIFNNQRNEMLPKSVIILSNEKPKVLPLAVIGFSLSILGLLCLLILKNFFLFGVILTLIIELAALIISISSLRKINKNPAILHGKSEAILGIIFSTVIILLPVMFYLIFTYFAFSLGIDFAIMI